MSHFLINYDDDEILYLINILDSKLIDLDDKCQFLRDFKDELMTYLSNNREV